MRRLFVPAVLAVLAVLLTPACQCGVTEVKLVHDDRERSYLLSLPADLTSPAPLVIALHGGGGGRADLFRRAAKLDARGAEAGFIVAFPNALYENWNDGRVGEELRENAEGIDDVGFILAVIDDIAQRAPLDDARVFVTGASNGGIFTNTLACGPASARLAGIAPVIGSMAVSVYPECAPEKRLPVWSLNGTDDEFVPLAGGSIYQGGRGEVVPVADVVAFWREHNGCAEAAEHDEHDAVEDDGTRLLVDTWSPCADGTELVHTLVEGGGHTWPGQGQLLEGVVGTVSEELDATDEILAFFGRF